MTNKHIYTIFITMLFLGVGAYADDRPVLHPDLVGPIQTTICPDKWKVVGTDCILHTLPRKHPVKTKSDAPMQNTYPLNKGGFNGGGW